MLIVGAGPAGLAAALAAAASGASVILCDEQAEPGGSLLHDPGATIDGLARAWLPATLAALAARGNVTLLPRTTAFGYYAHNFVGAGGAAHRPSADADRRASARAALAGPRAGEVVLGDRRASSARWCFPTTTGRGSCWPSAARTYLKRYGVRAGGRVVVATAHDDGLSRRARSRGGGRSRAAVVDLRPTADAPARRGARGRGLQVLTGRRVGEQAAVCASPACASATRGGRLGRRRRPRLRPAC